MPWLTYGKNKHTKLIKPNKLNHKPQAHARVSKENEGKNDCQLMWLKDQLWKLVEEQ